VFSKLARAHFISSLQAFEPLADTLVDALMKQTPVSIAIIAQSAVSALHSIVHNTRFGYHRVVAKLCASVRSKSAIQVRVVIFLSRSLV
jgi:hypothetical protein